MHEIDDAVKKSCGTGPRQIGMDKQQMIRAKWRTKPGWTPWFDVPTGVDISLDSWSPLGGPSTMFSVRMGSVQRPTIVDRSQNETQHGDKPQSLYSRGFELGGFAFLLEGKVVTVNESNKQYKWSADIVVVDDLGSTPEQVTDCKPMRWLFPPRRAVLARWHLFGCGCCP